jgi:hypothetical protein
MVMVVGRVGDPPLDPLKRVGPNGDGGAVQLLGVNESPG